MVKFDLSGVTDRLDRCEAVDEHESNIGVIHVESIEKKPNKEEK